MKKLWIVLLLVSCSSAPPSPSYTAPTSLHVDDSQKPTISTTQLNKILYYFNKNFPALIQSKTSAFISSLTTANIDPAGLVFLFEKALDSSPQKTYKNFLALLQNNYVFTDTRALASQALACFTGDSNACQNVPVFSRFLEQWTSNSISTSAALEGLNAAMGLPALNTIRHYPVTAYPTLDSNVHCGSNVCLDLSPIVNTLGIATSTDASKGAGIDGLGYAYNAGCVIEGYSNINGTEYFIPASATSLSPISNVFASSTGTTLHISPGNYSSLKILGTAVDYSGSYAPAKPFIFGYTSGSPVTQTQDFSDWGTNAASNTIGLTCAGRVQPGGGLDESTWYLYEYTLSLDPTRKLINIQTPPDGGVVIISMTLMP